MPPGVPSRRRSAPRGARSRRRQAGRLTMARYQDRRSTARSSVLRSPVGLSEVLSQARPAVEVSPPTSARSSRVGLKVPLRLEDGEPNDPAVLVTAVPNWTVGETFSTGRGHELRILRSTRTSTRWRDWTGGGERRSQVAEGEQVQPSKTLWDVLQLLIVPAILVGIGLAWNSHRADERPDAHQEPVALQTLQRSSVGCAHRHPHHA